MSEMPAQSLLPSRYQIGDHLVLNTHNNCLSFGDKVIELEHRLVLLLVYFLQHPNTVLAKEELLKTIWQGKVVNDDSLAVAVSHLRKALGDNPRAPQFIKTIPGVGYQFIGKGQSLPDSAPIVPAIESLPASRSVFWWWLVPSILIIVIFAVALINVKSSAPVHPAQRQQDYQEAKDLLAKYDSEAWRMAIKKFRELMSVYGESAEAYLGIAEAKVKLLNDKLALRENCAEVVGLLQKSLSLDPKFAAAHSLYGNVTFWCQRDYSLAEQHYLLSMEIDPRDDLTPMSYAQLLLSQGRFAESLTQVEASRRLNPLNYSIPNVVWLYQMQLRDDLALGELQRILSTEPDNRYYHISAQRIYTRMGDSEKAFAQWLWLMRDAGFSEADLQAAEQEFAKGGLLLLNRWLLERKELADLGEYTPPLSWARYALVAGDYAVAMDYLEAAYSQRQSPLLWAAVDPAYKPLHDNPRFQKILADLKLPENK
ncbi:MAG TPA: winged helix-turn-helix domain-containing protein [Cellvibrio sp.]|nr:winged helix-turn-helix domain-containing protein [Cellvibrio sp.]